MRRQSHCALNSHKDKCLLMSYRAAQRIPCSEHTLPHRACHTSKLLLELVPQYSNGHGTRLGKEMRPNPHLF